MLLRERYTVLYNVLYTVLYTILFILEISYKINFHANYTVHYRKIALKDFALLIPSMTVSKQTKPKEVTQSVVQTSKFVAQLAEADTQAFKSWTKIKSLRHCSFYILEACHLGYKMFQFNQSLSAYPRCAVHENIQFNV